MNHEKPQPEQETSRWPIAPVVAIGAGILAAVLRVVPHPPNFSGVGGLGIFGGARLRGWQAYLLPLGIMIASDLALWAFTLFDPKYSLAHLSRIYVYASFMIYVLIGRWLADRDSIVSVTIAATLGGLQFFVITNFCDWLFQPLQIGYDAIPAPWKYSRDLDGLITCFGYALGFYQQETAGLSYPFMTVTNFPMALLVWTVLGDVLFTTAYLVAYGKLARPTPSVQESPVPTPVA